MITSCSFYYLGFKDVYHKRYNGHIGKNIKKFALLEQDANYNNYTIELIHPMK